MTDSLYSQKEWAQFRGPTTSDRYNLRSSNVFKDLVYLYNKVGLADENAKLAFRRLIKDHLSLMQVLADVLQRLEDLDVGEQIITFGHPGVIDNDRFVDTDFEVSETDILSWDSNHGIITLPKTVTSSVSKVRFTNTQDQTIIPSTLEAWVVGDTSTADNSTAVISTSDILQAIRQELGSIWERNVVVDAPDTDGAALNLYLRLPTDYSVSEDTNGIFIHPYPMMGTDILDVAYSIDASPMLNETDGYVTLNSSGYWDSNDRAVNWIAPGSWSGDEILNSGPKAFHFDPKPITAIRITLRQRNYMVENLKYIYTYGLSWLDVRYDKFRDSGKTIVLYEPGVTFSTLEEVTPEIWNVSEAELNDIFSFRVIWETSYDSGVYTLTPVPDSTRCWIEITLNKTLGNGTPALSGLVIGDSGDV